MAQRVAQIASLTNGSITATDGATATFSGLAAFTNDSFYGESGGVLNLPTVTTYTGQNNANTTIEAQSANSQVNLPNLITFNGALNGSLSFAAAPVFVDEFNPAGNLVQSIPLPTAVNGNQRRLTASGGSCLVR